MATSGVHPARSSKALECVSEQSTQGSDSEEAVATTAASTCASTVTPSKPRRVAKPRLRNRFAIESDSDSEDESGAEDANDCAASEAPAVAATLAAAQAEADEGFSAVARKKKPRPRPAEVKLVTVPAPAPAEWSDSDDDYVAGRSDQRQHRTGDGKRSCGFKAVKQRACAKEKRDRQRQGLPRLAPR